MPPTTITSRVSGRSRASSVICSGARFAISLPARLHRYTATLRSASVVCLNFDAFQQAWTNIQEAFDVREGHGRLKNNLFESSRPQDLLVNVLVEPVGFASIVGEVQIHQKDIILLKEVRSRVGG